MIKHVPLTLVSFILVTPFLLGQANAPVRAQEPGWWTQEKIDCGLPSSAAYNDWVAQGSLCLKQLITQLLISPDDQSVREKIIALALTINPKPATPDDATMAEGAAEYAFKNAKSNVDYSKAAKQYEKALLLAPWLATDYFNCGVAHEKAGENKEAIRSFNLYLLAAPNADDAQAIKKRIGGLQYAAQESEDAASEQARVANEQARAAAQQAAVYQGLDGGVWLEVEWAYNSHRHPPIPSHSHMRNFIEVHGDQLEFYWTDDLNGRVSSLKATFNSRRFRVASEGTTGMDITISDDGKSIVTETMGTDGSNGPVLYNGYYKRIQ
jgi:tetratricopeptide (TPR) repeat protein